MNKLVIAVAAVSSAFIPVAQAAYTSGTYYFTGTDPLSPASWGIGDGSETLQTVTEASLPDETCPVVFGETTFPSTFKLNGDATYKTFTAKNADGDTTIDLASGDEAVTNHLATTGNFSVEKNTLFVKDGVVSITGLVVVASDARVVCSNAYLDCRSNSRDLFLNAKGVLQFVKSARLSTWGEGSGTNFDKTFYGKKLIFEGEGTIWTIDGASFNFDTSVDQSLIIRNKAAISNVQFLRLYDKTTFSLVDGGYFSSIKGGRFSIGKESIIYVSNTVSTIPYMGSIPSKSRFIVMNDSEITLSGGQANPEATTLYEDAEALFDGSSTTATLGEMHLRGDNALWHISNGAKVTSYGFSAQNASNSCFKLTGGSTLTLPEKKHWKLTTGISLNERHVSVIVDDSSLIYNKTSIQAVQTNGVIHLRGKSPLFQIEQTYTLNNADATEEAEYPTLKFTLPEAVEDVWTDAPVQVGTSATIGANSIISVEVPEALAKAGKRIRVPLITAETALSLPDDMTSFIRTLAENKHLPDGATLKVGNYNAETGKWEAVAGGKTLFADIPSQGGFMMIVR